jgi:hypothetical protein
VLQRCAPAQKRLVASCGMMASLPHAQLPVEGVVGLLPPRAGHRHPGGFASRRPAHLLDRQPVPYALAMGRSRPGGHVVGKAPPPWAQRTPPHALPLPRPGPQGVALGAQARPRQERPQARAGAVEASHQDAPDPLRGLRLAGGMVARLIRLGQGRRPGVLGVAPMPKPTATDARGQRPLGGKTMAGLVIGQARDRQRPPTPAPPAPFPLRTQRTDEARERHGGERGEPGAPRHTAPPMRRPEGGAGPFRGPPALAEEAVGQDGDRRFAPRTLDPPDGHPTQADAPIMGVARQASATGRPGCARQAKGPNEGEDPREKRLAICQPADGGGCVSKIAGDGAVCSCRFGRCAQVSPLCHQVS